MRLNEIVKEYVFCLRKAYLYQPLGMNVHLCHLTCWYFMFKTVWLHCKKNKFKVAKMIYNYTSDVYSIVFQHRLPTKWQEFDQKHHANFTKTLFIVLKLSVHKCHSRFDFWWHHRKLNSGFSTVFIHPTMSKQLLCIHHAPVDILIPTFKLV